MWDLQKRFRFEIQIWRNRASLFLKRTDKIYRSIKFVLSLVFHESIGFVSIHFYQLVSIFERFHLHQIEIKQKTKTK